MVSNGLVSVSMLNIIESASAKRMMAEMSKLAARSMLTRLPYLALSRAATLIDSPRVMTCATDSRREASGYSNAVWRLRMLPN